MLFWLTKKVRSAQVWHLVLQIISSREAVQIIAPFFKSPEALQNGLPLRKPFCASDH